MKIPSITDDEDVGISFENNPFLDLVMSSNRIEELVPCSNAYLDFLFLAQWRCIYWTN